MAVKRDDHIHGCCCPSNGRSFFSATVGHEAAELVLSEESRELLPAHDRPRGSSFNYLLSVTMRAAAHDERMLDGAMIRAFVVLG